MPLVARPPPQQIGQHCHSVAGSHLTRLLAKLSTPANLRPWKRQSERSLFSGQEAGKREKGIYAGPRYRSVGETAYWIAALWRATFQTATLFAHQSSAAGVENPLALTNPKTARLALEGSSNPAKSQPHPRLSVLASPEKNNLLKLTQ